MSDALKHAGELALAEITRLWSMDIIDPPIGSKHPRATDSLVVINEIIAANGWVFSLPHGRYLGNGPPQWCGMTAGYCWAKAGLAPKMLQVFWASTDRLISWASYQPFNGHRNVPRPAAPEERRLLMGLHPGAPLSFQPRAGDVVIVGDGSRTAGNHVTLCKAYDAEARVFSTISGNGSGVGPKGDPREGISARSFAIDGDHGYRVMWVVRPGVGDLLAERE
jgi:hypothetical protein